MKTINNNAGSSFFDSFLENYQHTEESRATNDTIKHPSGQIPKKSGSLVLSDLSVVPSDRYNCVTQFFMRLFGYIPTPQTLAKKLADKTAQIPSQAQRARDEISSYREEANKTEALSGTGHELVRIADAVDNLRSRLLRSSSFSEDSELDQTLQNNIAAIRNAGDSFLKEENDVASQDDLSKGLKNLSQATQTPESLADGEDFPLPTEDITPRPRTRKSDRVSEEPLSPPASPLSTFSEPEAAKRLRNIFAQDDQL